MLGKPLQVNFPGSRLAKAATSQPCAHRRVPGQIPRTNAALPADYKTFITRAPRTNPPPSLSAIANHTLSLKQSIDRSGLAAHHSRERNARRRPPKKAQNPRRVLQPAVLAQLDTTYTASLGSALWAEAKAAMLVGRKHWQYAAARNRFFMPAGDEFAKLLQREKNVPSKPSQADLQVLLGYGNATASNVSIHDICAGLPTLIECYVSTQKGTGGRTFPRCGGVAPTSPYWLMSAASVLPVLALDPQPGDKVLDLCAAPGGKSFLVTQHVDGISLHANDLKRGFELERALANHVPNADFIVTSEDGRHLSGTFDKVLIDAPCTTDKHILLSTNATAQVELQRLLMGYYPQLQLELLRSGLKALKPGGSLVYCTCTLDARQNSLVVEKALQEEQHTGAYHNVPLYDSVQERFGRHFNLYREGGDAGVLVVPSLDRNWGPLYVALIQRSIS